MTTTYDIGYLRIGDEFIDPDELTDEQRRMIDAGPALLAALEFLVDAADTEPSMNIYRAHIAQARAAIAKARV